MNSFSAWFTDNKLAGSSAVIFLLLLSGTGWWTYQSWDNYAVATQGYEEASAKLSKLNKQSPFPNDSNKAKLEDNLKKERLNLAALEKTLQAYNAPSFANLEQAKPQDRPQLFQDALRAQVTKIKSLAASKDVTLPPGFYLGMEEFENRLPSSEEVLQLSRQLSALNWLVEKLSANSGLIVAEFTRTQTTSTAKKDAVKKSPLAPAAQSVGSGSAATSYETLGTIQTSFRCDQHSLNELVNAISASPYFFVLEGFQLQNTSPEPPHRDIGTNSAAAAPQAGDSQSAIRKFPILVGREQLNVSMKLKILEFPLAPEPPQPKAAPKK